MRELHLFAGIGGGILGGMLLGHRCVGAVEIDPYCRRVLEARQRDGILEPFPIHDDIRTFDGTAWRGHVDVVCGGFPCQPWSSAGKRRGTADSRHLWPEMARVVAECRPAYVFAENVSMAAFEEPWRDLRRLGYRVPPALCLSAGDLGAPFPRKRWWVLAADAGEGGRDAREWTLRARQSDAARGATRAADADPLRQSAVSVDDEVASACDVGDADGPRLAQWEGQPGDTCTQQSPALGATWRAAAPRLRRLVSGAARGMDSRRQRIQSVGNAQVPAVAAAAFRELMARLP